MTSSDARHDVKCKRTIGSCVRACVTDVRATVYVCVHMPKEVYEIEKMCVHAAEDAGSSEEIEYCSLS